MYNNAREYAIRISNHVTSFKGEHTVVSIGCNASTKLSSSKYSIWVNDNKLYFSPSKSGLTKTDAGKINVCSQTEVEMLQDFLGEYDVMEYDNAIKCYYIDIKDKHSYTKTNQSTKGISRPRVSLQKAQIEPEIEKPIDSIVEYKKGEYEDSVKPILLQMIYEYVSDGEYEKAQIVTEVIKRVEK